MRVPLLIALLAMVAFAGCLGNEDPVDTDGDGFTDSAEVEAGTDPTNPLSMPGVTPMKFGDVTVLAIVDSGFNPYHWDFLAEHMPQHLDNDTSNDLPLDQPPHMWVPGFPSPDTFASYESLDLNLTPDDKDAVASELHASDSVAWGEVQTSNADAVHYNWIPGTKIIGYVNYASSDGFGAGSHGGGTTSVSVGNLYGTCPECLLVFLNSFSSAANPWMANQDWIDVQSNSWGASTAYRENIYTNCDLDTLAAGVARGQQIFWSAGNGQGNAFVAPVNTLNSCQKGADFLVTVGAISPDNQGSYTGHGKPVDVASFGRGYPRAGSGSVTSEGSFSGTSNAAPVTAGTFAKSLWTLRNEFKTDRIQQDGVIAQGPAGCGDANPDCAMADGNVTVHELREAFFRAAERTDAFFTATTLGATPDQAIPAGNEETEFLTEGHGSFLGKLGDAEGEIQAIVDEVKGNVFDPMTAEEMDYMIGLSYCSQQVWGAWPHGFWQEGDALPAEDPARPITTWMNHGCAESMNALLAPFR